MVDNLLRPPVGVTETYVQTPALDGGAWLLPAYRFTFDDGSSRTVLAVSGTPGHQLDRRPQPARRPGRGLRRRRPPLSHGWAFRVAERDGVSELLHRRLQPDPGRTWPSPTEP